MRDFTFLLRAFLVCLLATSLLQSVQAAVIVQLRVIEGAGESHALGSRATRGVTVLVTDENGRPVERATVSFQLPESGSGGTFSSGSRTEIVTTGADGKASVWGMRWNRVAGTFEIRVTASKDQARAGTLIQQSLADNPEEASSGGTGKFPGPHHSHMKWILIAALAAGAGAGAGLALGRSSGSSSATAVSTAAVQIGSPTIIVSPHP